MPAPTRAVTTILAELAEVRRHLRDTPPHHGSGVREQLQARVGSLERELAAARASAEDAPPSDR